MCKTFCSNPNCGADLTQLADPPRSPCPHCGATERRVDRAAQEELSFKTQLKTRLKRQGKSKPKIESVAGDDLHRDTGSGTTKSAS